MEPNWLRWSKALQAIAQNGLTFSRDPFALEHYATIRQIAVEMIATHTPATADAVMDLFTEQRGYATPKVGVRGVVFQDEKVLLVKGAADGKWSLPGGWADVNETPTEAVVREIREESGYETVATKLLGVLDRTKQGHVPPFPFHVYKLFVQCEITGGVGAASTETTQVGFFAEDELPDLSPSRTTARQASWCFEHRRSPHLPAHLD
jgi:ADP-ribose pyrophosphatase YjhB (NUDIX family)